MQLNPMYTNQAMGYNENKIALDDLFDQMDFRNNFHVMPFEEH